MKTRFTFLGSFIALLISTTATAQTQAMTEIKSNNCDNSDITIQSTTINVSCNGDNDGSIDINLTGGTSALKYSWLHDLDAPLDLQNLSAGTYVIHVSDSNYCIIGYSIVITEPDAIDIQAAVIYPGLSTLGSIDLSISGGSPIYSYVWSNGAITEDVDNLSEDDYTVTVTDVNGCFIKESYALYNPNMVINPNVVLYPNPAVEFTTITLENTQGAPVIRNEQGQVMNVNTYFRNGSVIIQGLPAGSYWITCSSLSGKTQTVQYKIVK